MMKVAAETSLPLTNANDVVEASASAEPSPIDDKSKKARFARTAFLVFALATAAIAVTSWQLALSGRQTIEVWILVAGLSLNTYGLLAAKEWWASASIAAALTVSISLYVFGFPPQVALAGYAVVLVESFIVAAFLTPFIENPQMQVILVVCSVGLFAEVLWRGGTWLEAAGISLFASIEVSALAKGWGRGGAIAGAIITAIAVWLLADQALWLPPLAKAFGFSILVWVALMVFGVVCLLTSLAIWGKKGGRNASTVLAALLLTGAVISVISLVSSVIVATGEDGWFRATTTVGGIPVAIFCLEVGVGTKVKDALTRAISGAYMMTAFLLLSSLFVLAGADWLEAFAAVAVLVSFSRGAEHWRMTAAIVVLTVSVGASAGFTWLECALGAAVMVFTERRRSILGGTIFDLLNPAYPTQRPVPRRDETDGQ